MQVQAQAQENGNRSILLCLSVTLASLRRTCKAGRRKPDKHKHKALMLGSYVYTRLKSLQIYDGSEN